MSRRALVNLVFFAAVFGLMLVWAAANIISVRRLEQPYVVKGVVTATSGILPNAEVAYLGVHYGTVTEIKRITGDVCHTDAAPHQEGCVELTMDIDRGKRIPQHSLARIFRKSAIGEPYIDFQPPATFDPTRAGDGDFMPTKGYVVPISETRNPLEFSEVLKNASALLANIDPVKAGSLIHELALALHGRGDDLRQLTIAMDDLTATFAAKTDVLDRLATNNTAITHVIATNANDFGQSLTNLRLVADALAGSVGDATVVLEQGSQLFGRLADLVANQKGNLDCTLHDLADVIDATTTPARLAGLSQLLDIGPGGFGLLASTIDQQPDGPWARVNLITNPNNPPAQYVPRRDLPVVPAVAPCTSTVAAGSGPDFIPSQILGSSGGSGVIGSLPATGGVALLGIIAALTSLSFASRWIARAGRRPR
jgi:phospholipid/cholesterol/gamma-HCH transport system substrate-binding protein